MPATNPLNYNNYVSQIANMGVINVHTVSGVVVGNGDAAFDTMLPQALNYAELRIARDLDLLSSVTTGSYTLTAGNNALAVPVDDFVTVQTIATAGGPLLPVTVEYLQNVYGSSSSAGKPAYFAMYGGDRATGGTTSNNIIVGPWPDSNYPVTITGTIRLPSLYKFANPAQAATETTWISTWVPDMLIMASMIFVSDYQRQFGATSGNSPEMPGSYESQYNNLLRGAVAEEYRKKFQGSAWSSMSTPIGATAGR